MQANFIVSGLRKLSRDIDLQSIVKMAAERHGCKVIVEELVDMSGADGSLIIYECLDGSRWAWFSLFGMEDIEDDMNQIPIHFDNVMPEDGK